jgi:hypothetical protein
MQSTFASGGIGSMSRAPSLPEAGVRDIELFESAQQITQFGEGRAHRYPFQVTS